jgi:hypothetical protein
MDRLPWLTLVVFILQLCMHFISVGKLKQQQIIISNQIMHSVEKIVYYSKEIIICSITSTGI